MEGPKLQSWVPKSIHTQSHGLSLEILRGWRSQKLRYLKESMKLNLPEGWVETEEKTSTDTFGNHTLHGSYK